MSQQVATIVGLGPCVTLTTWSEKGASKNFKFQHCFLRCLIPLCLNPFWDSSGYMAVRLLLCFLDASCFFVNERQSSRALLTIEATVHLSSFIPDFFHIPLFRTSVEVKHHRLDPCYDNKEGCLDRSHCQSSTSQ